MEVDGAGVTEEDEADAPVEIEFDGGSEGIEGTAPAPADVDVEEGTVGMALADGWADCEGGGNVNMLLLLWLLGFVDGAEFVSMFIEFECNDTLGGAACDAGDAAGMLLLMP